METAPSGVSRTTSDLEVTGAVMFHSSMKESCATASVSPFGWNATAFAAMAARSSTTLGW